MGASLIAQAKQEVQYETSTHAVVSEILLNYSEFNH